jgi:acetate kinase
VILAHLGNGASLAAVRDGQSIDTSMGFTPAAELVMSSRTGDLDPGLVSHLARTEHMSAKKFQEMVTNESGLLGVSEISSDVRELLAWESEDVRAAEAVALFCYQAKKWIGSFDRFHLVADVIDRVPQVGDKGLYLKQQLKEKPIDHKQYIEKFGQGLPEIRNWKWGVPNPRNSANDVASLS